MNKPEWARLATFKVRVIQGHVRVGAIRLSTAEEQMAVSLKRSLLRKAKKAGWKGEVGLVFKVSL